MLKRLVMVVGVLMIFVSVSMAEEAIDELSAVRRQAREERRKEEELQMMRLELEKLKLQVETQKTLSEMGLPGATSSAGVAQISLEVKNITLTPEGARAVVETGGARRELREGDTAGPFTVKKINMSDIVLADDKGVEFKTGLHL